MTYQCYLAKQWIIMGFPNLSRLYAWAIYAVGENTIGILKIKIIVMLSNLYLFFIASCTCIPFDIFWFFVFFLYWYFYFLLLLGMPLRTRKIDNYCFCNSWKSELYRKEAINQSTYKTDTENKIKRLRATTIALL